MGSSIPIVLLPGIVEILADSELVFLAISSDKLIIFLFSINFRVKFILDLFKKIFLSLNQKKNNQKVYEELKPSISPAESFIQEDLPFTNI